MVFGLASVKVRETDDWKKVEADIIEESIASNEYAVAALRDYLHKVRNPSPSQEPGGALEYHGIYGWVAAGGLPVLNTKDGSYIALIYRDENAPTYPNTFTVTSGLSESWKEIKNMRTLAIRETIEELLITDGDRWLLPTVSEDVLSKDYIQSIMDDRVGAWQNNSKIKVPEMEYTPIEISSQPLGSDSLVLNYGGETNTISGHFVIDNEYNMIDLIDVVHFDLLEYSINELTFYDGETPSGNVLDREVHLIELSEVNSIFDGPLKSRYVFQSGELVRENSTSEDPITLVGSSSAKSLSSSDILPLG